MRRTDHPGATSQSADSTSGPPEASVLAEHYNLVWLKYIEDVSGPVAWVYNDAVVVAFFVL